jgi:hypothetical protein
MTFYVYRDGLEIKIRLGGRETAEELRKKFGSEHLGTRPYDNRDDADKYRERWQQRVHADPGCKPPYSVDKD